MKIYIWLKDLLSLLNIGLILYLLILKCEKNEKNIIKSILPKIVCFLLMIMIRFLENRIEMHVLYIYLTVIVITLILGYFCVGHTIKYNLLIACIFLSIVSLGQVLACTMGYILAKRPEALYELPMSYQIKMLIITEIVIAIGVLICGRIVRKIPLEISRISFFTIMIPNIINLSVLILLGDKMYYSTYVYGNIESVITMLIASFVMVVGSICNIAVLEYYLNVKYIENEKKLQISEISLQYDYYVRLEKDMDAIRKLSHDIRNHLEALKGNNDETQKKEYIGSIEDKLKQYESYYRTGNTFIDNLLHRKKLDATEQDIQFKVVADLSLFRNIKNEDLCVIISNAVDNALRECSLKHKEEPSSECIVLLKAGKVREFLSIVCENSVRDKQAVLIKDAEVLKTTKVDKKNHGYGMENIENAVQRYGGEVSFAINDGMFCLSIIIPI